MQALHHAVVEDAHVQLHLNTPRATGVASLLMGALDVKLMRNQPVDGYAVPLWEGMLFRNGHHVAMEAQENEGTSAPVYFDVDGVRCVLCVAADAISGRLTKTPLCCNSPLKLHSRRRRLPRTKRETRATTRQPCPATTGRMQRS